MSKEQPDRWRLAKNDAKKIVKALQSKGFAVQRVDDRIDAWCKETERHICTFDWHPAHNDVPGRWRFVLVLSDCFSDRDLRTAVREASRVRGLVKSCRETWVAYRLSKSNRRWAAYRGFVAALFMRQDP
jgi:hypothetical protein